MNGLSQYPVSGRYEGEMIAPAVGRDLLDLRVDVDPRYANSPVTGRVSGDLYQMNRLNLPGSPPRVWRVFRESWIVDNPQVTRSATEVVITGRVRFWKALHPVTTLSVRIALGATSVGPAEATFTQQGNLSASFSCVKRSDCFRDLNLEMDLTQSVNQAPLLPVYDIHAHANRPVDLPQRTLSVEEVYREAGVCLTIRPVHTVVDDSAADFNSWSPAELHDTMEQHFSQFGGEWPNWEMWGFLAGRYDDPAVGGVMFDAAAVYGGAGQAPERQGFAVFRNHFWFNNLPAGTPSTQAEAEALRQFLYTWVHEAGHAFNFLHSWDKNRPDALSWMNYDWRYDNRNGADSFWANFRFRFDDEELIHVRHGDRPSVIMGGDPWASGGHLEAPPGAGYLETPPGAMASVHGHVPIEALVRSKTYFEFMEEVTVEIRIRNLFRDLPLNLDTHLNPEYGGVTIYIRRPDGRIVEFEPIMCKLAPPAMKILQPQRRDVEGPDRYSEEVSLSYGRYGFYFDEPGQYLVRALYQGPGDVLIPSNIHRVRVGNPLTREEDRIAQDFFSYEVGMNLYLKGSRSPFLTKGMNVLHDIAERYGHTLRGAKASTVVANSIAEPFFQVQNKVVKKLHEAQPQEALRLTQPALEVYQREKIKPLNLAYHNLVRRRAQCLAQVGESDKAKQELTTLRQDLQARGANQTVLEEIAGYAEQIE